MATVATPQHSRETPPAETLESVYLATLAVDHAHDFDLYLCAGGRTSLYRAKQTPFTVQDRDRLIEAGVRLLYIQPSERDEYRGFLLSQFTALAAREAGPAETVCEWAGQCGDAIAHELCRSPTDGALQKAAEQFVTSTVDLLLHRPEAASGLVRVLQHDYYTYTHLLNVSILSLVLALRAGIRDQTQLYRIGLGGLLHDIGKTRISAAILNCTGKLTDRMRTELRRHPDYGYEMLMDRPELPEEVRLMVHQHHERLDGSGYPIGLVGDEISLGARICAVADIHDAMTCDRPYRRALPMDRALGQLRKMASGRLEPDIVRVWVAAVNELNQEQMQVHPPAGGLQA